MSKWSLCHSAIDTKTVMSDIATLLQFDREQEVSAENFIALNQEANEILCHTTWLQTKNKTKKVSF